MTEPRRSLVALLPMKANSVRVPSKNFRPLAGKPLFRWILDTLLAMPEIELLMLQPVQIAMRAACVQSIGGRMARNRNHMGKVMPCHTLNGPWLDPESFSFLTAGSPMRSILTQISTWLRCFSASGSSLARRAAPIHRGGTVARQSTHAREKQSVLSWVGEDNPGSFGSKLTCHVELTELKASEHHTPCLF